MEEAPSNPCRRDLASDCAVGSKTPFPKNSSEEMPFCVPNLERAYFSSSSMGQVGLVSGMREGC